MESHAEAVRLADAKAARMLGVIAASIMKNPGEPEFRRLRSSNAEGTGGGKKPGACQLHGAACTRGQATVAGKVSGFVNSTHVLLVD